VNAVNEVSGAIIDAAIKVHSRLGPGLLESVYEKCLAVELTNRGIKCLTQVGVPVVYEGVELDIGFRIDLLVEDVVIVEIKAVEKLTSLHQAQLLTYLKLANKKVGLLLNFNVEYLKDGIIRRVN